MIFGEQLPNLDAPTSLGSCRIRPSSWVNPDLDDWCLALDRAAHRHRPSGVVLVAHSLGCLAVGFWLRRYQPGVRAALLVAPPDPTGPNFPAAAANGDGYDGNPAPHDHQLIAVSTATGKQVGHAVALSDAPQDLAITPDERTLYIAGTYGVVRVPLSLATGGPATQPTTVIGWLGNEGDFALAISPDGRNLYVGTAGIQLIRLN